MLYVSYIAFRNGVNWKETVVEANLRAFKRELVKLLDNIINNVCETP